MKVKLNKTWAVLNWIVINVHVPSGVGSGGSYQRTGVPRKELGGDEWFGKINASKKTAKHFSNNGRETEEKGKM